MGNSCGITWVELALSFILEQGNYIPILRPNATGELVVIAIHTLEHVHEHMATISEQADNLRLLLDNVVALQTEDLWPKKIPRKKIASLYLQGHGQYRQGLQCRPAVPRQGDVAALLQRKFTTDTRRLDWMPAIEHGPAMTTLSGTWQERTRHAKNRVRYIRIQRAAPGQ
eukprot:Skav212885  [mRNA]  locus=scaffold1006:313841:314350:+ [translate_table: standard]